MRELDNDEDQYDVRSRLVAKQQALDPTSQSQTLLEQFLRQTEPPEKEVLSPDAVDVSVIIEREEGEEEEEEGAEREAAQGSSHEQHQPYSVQPTSEETALSRH
ncbi:hypothetical protein FOMG_17973 [Fusarium oxysporum f. sp. melonis 26406]|uniref:Uncharacterized protein n=1 Tax=Fusarium oxysporum f. sp. melonis 26406 TaxID=1089452 RepID=W9ZW97_FUSOX|nr:hypothetical protein FOMG_17973 [Fusarium oxysporum f. sp. melonis 26406]